MSRVIKFRSWQAATNDGRGEMCGEGMHTGANLHCDRDTGKISGSWLIKGKSEPVIVMQFTGILDKWDAEVFEDDVVRFHFPDRDYETHYGDRIPEHFGGRYTVPLEPKIVTRDYRVQWVKGAFCVESYFEGEGVMRPLSDFIWEDASDVPSLFNCLSDEEWKEDLAYLLEEYNLPGEASLLAHVSGCEVIGNIHQNPELLEQRE